MHHSADGTSRTATSARSGPGGIDSSALTSPTPGRAGQERMAIALVDVRDRGVRSVRWLLTSPFPESGVGDGRDIFV